MPEDNQESALEAENESPSLLEQRRMKKQQDIDNNTETIRTATEVLKDKNIPYASEAATIIDAADKKTGGRVTKRLGKNAHFMNKHNGMQGRKMQRDINRFSKKGGNEKLRKANQLSSLNASNPNANTETTNAEIKFPIKSTLIISTLIVVLSLFIPLMIFIVIFYDEDEIGGAGGAGGGYPYGETTCATITVVNTGCDDNNQNCTNIYNGDVEVEEYVAGVVAAEAGDANNLEYYKLVAIKARTYLFDRVNSNCTVSGNASFQKYIDVSTSAYSELIKQAVNETKDLVMVEQEELINVSYNYGNVTNEDTSNYYLQYYSEGIGEKRSQTIPKEWAKNSVYKTYLENWETNKYNSKYKGISLIGALYLIESEGYSYNRVIEYYYGDQVTLEKNEMILAGVNGFINPTKNIYCSSPFGNRTHPINNTTEFHTGIDIAISGGEPIYATKEGTITKLVNTVSAINNCSYGYGNNIIIDHGDGTTTLYAHMMYNSIPSSLQVGSTVKQGEQIGRVGSTGCSTGNHLHYEIRLNNELVNPAEYLNLSSATGTCKR